MSPQSPYPPLITPRSPSYERARYAFENATASVDPLVFSLLARLSEAEQNAERACTELAPLLRSESDAGHMRVEASTHEARRLGLWRLIETLGGPPPRPGAHRQILFHGPDAIARARPDLAALHALKAMRAELSAAYDEAIASSHLDQAQRDAVADLATFIGTLADDASRDKAIGLAVQKAHSQNVDLPDTISAKVHGGGGDPRRAG